MINIVAHELKYYIKNTIELSNLTIYLLTILLLFPFGLQLELNKLSELGIAIVWVILISAVTFGSNLYERDNENGRLELYQLLPIPMELVVLGKWLSFWLLVTVPLLAFIPLMNLFLNLPQGNWLQLAVGLAFGAAAVSALCCLGAGLMSGLGRGGAVLNLIVTPLSIPVMIFGTAYCRQPELWNSSLLFLGAFTLLIVPVMCFSVASSLRAGN